MFAGRRVCLLAPYPPRKGGVTVQTQLLADALEREGATLLKVDTNLQKLRFPVLGTPIRLAAQPWVVAFRLLMALPKCEVLHIQAAVNWGYLPALIGVPLARLFGRRSVMSFQSGLGPVFMDRFGWLVKMPFLYADVTTVCTRELHEEFGKRGFDTVLMHNLYESEIFKYRERTRVEPKIVWTRSFEKLYDPWSAIKTFEIVKREYPEATMTMTSTGPLWSPIKDYVDSNGIKGIDLPGRVPTERVSELMTEASICLNTTQQDGLPTALLEAGACGLAIVSTNAGGIPSLLKDGVSGLLVNVGDYEAMAAAVVRFVREPDLALRLGDGAREAVKDYSWERTSAVLADCYGFVGEQRHRQAGR